MPQATCRICGVTFLPSPGQPHVYCGDECRRTYNREAVARSRAKARDARPDKPCPECATPFTITQGNKRYCSVECARSASLRRRRDTEYQPAAKNCDHCAGEIPYKSGKIRYCSKACQVAGIAKEARWRIKGLDPAVAGAITECALCGATDRRLVIDHDHACCSGGNACGKCFRGMLCQPCNVALGMLQESPDLLRKAAAYIEDAQQRLTASG